MAESFTQHAPGKGASSILDPSPCRSCTRCCKGERCPNWVRWFSESWPRVQRLFR